MISALISRLIILAFGTLYPAYSSYKAVRTRDVKEYVKWMMYWIVFALFTFVETFTDVLFSFWFPFYYEFKVAIVFWLLSPATKGSSFLYRNFVHPALQKRENEIDDYLNQAKEKGYSTVMQIGSKGMTYATNMIVQTALKGGGGIMDQLKKSYSLSDLAPRAPSTRPHSAKPALDDDTPRGQDTIDSPKERRSSSRNRRSVNISPSIDMYFSEVDVNLRQPPHTAEVISDIRSSEDISSGYSSTDQLYMGQTGEGVLTRASSVSLRGARGRSTSSNTRQSTNTRRAPLTDDYYEEDDEFHPHESEEYYDRRFHQNQIIYQQRIINQNMQNAQYYDDSVSIVEVNDDVQKVSDSKRSSQSSVFSEAAESVGSLSLKSFGSSNLSIESDSRGGKYRKLKAPPPPSGKTTPEIAASIISDVSAAINLNPLTPPIPRRAKESDV